MNALTDTIQMLTGAAGTEREFRRSTTLPCDHCAHVRDTALVSIDGDQFERLCADCLWSA